MICWDIHPVALATRMIHLFRNRKFIHCESCLCRNSAC